VLVAALLVGLRRVVVPWRVAALALRVRTHKPQAAISAAQQQVGRN